MHPYTSKVLISILAQVLGLISLCCWLQMIAYDMYPNHRLLLALGATFQLVGVLISPVLIKIAWGPLRQATDDRTQSSRF